ncbi:proprotein convertase P-domain-containing protein [Vibrio cortegadensis]|uniref:proprotein convertase P-domain-containing protein n=1 Tax=Vibrio cortegadensis TaxID=1328770 RepID=UPI00352DE85B
MKLKPLALSLLIACATTVQAAEWDYPVASASVNNEAEAKTYLDTNYVNAGEFKYRYKTQSQLGAHYNFDVWVKGEYQAQRTVVVTTDKEHHVVRVFKSFEDTIIRNGEPMIAAELESPRELQAQEPPALSSGNLIDIEVSLFNPDLRTMQQQAAPDSTWASLADYPQPIEYVTKSIEVLQSGGKFYLSNPRLKQVDATGLFAVPAPGEAPVLDTSNFLTTEGVQTFDSPAEMQNAEFGDNAFPQLMAFYHLDSSMQYLTSLAYDLFDEPLRFDARGLSKDNSTYYYGPKALMLGVGGVSPDAVDGDVVLHEFGHGIHYQIVPDWAYGHTGAIAEGFADYWAGSASYKIQYLDTSRRGQEFDLDTVFNWDGVFGTRKTTRSLWNQHARYFENSEYPAHVSVAGELGDELWSTPLFQALKASVERYGDGSDGVFREFDAIILEGMFGIGRGVKMHDLAESTVFAASGLFPDKEYAQLLTDSFNKHNLLKAPFRVRYDARYIAQSQNVGLNLTQMGREARIKGQWHLNNASVFEIDETLSDTSAMKVALPSNLTCGMQFDSTVSLDYQFGDGLKTHQWAESVALVNGTPKLEIQPQAVNSSLPEQGDRLFSQTLSDKSRTIDDSFAVYLNIEHASLQDLQVTLVSPQGKSVVLLSHQSSNTNGFKGYFTAQYDEELQALVGQPSWGTWRLEVSDRVSGNSGVLKEWGVSHFAQYQCSADTTNESDSGGSGGSGSPFALFGLLLLSMVRVIRSR